MKMKLFVLIGLLMAAAPAFAHHGFAAEFDRTRPLKLKGTVVKWEVTNPHSWIQMDAKGDDGKVVTWMIEGGSPNNLYRLGFTKDSLPPGSEIVVEGYQAKDLSTRAVGKSVTFSDGRKLFLGLQALNSDPETKK
jgi:Family of unknown function (DUF6152)